MHAPALSFEVFPPASVEASFKLWAALDRLQAFEPRFISVTYGAQGSTRALTQDTALAARAQTGLPVAAHLTAAGACKADVLTRADMFARSGIKDIVALRGDGAEPGASFAPHPEGFASSLELITALADQDRFTLRVGAYPDSHPNAASSQQNIDYLKAKFDAGADEAITQFFFDAETYLRFRDACDRAGLFKPIIPGILPVTNWSRIEGFAKRCGAAVPASLAQAFEKAERDGRGDLLALAHATELCDTLLTEGAQHLHFYTLNRAALTEQVLIALGVPRSVATLRQVA